VFFARIAVLSLAIVLHSFLGPLALRAESEEKIEVTVVPIFASSKHNLIDRDLANIAKAVQQHRPKLTGFRKGKASKQTLAVGGKAKFPLGENQSAQVSIQQGVDKENRIALTVKPPECGTIVYASTVGKYFPIVTRHRNGNQDFLIVAVMVRPPSVVKKKE
jgi:hypothetical protein